VGVINGNDQKGQDWRENKDLKRSNRINLKNEKGCIKREKNQGGIQRGDQVGLLPLTVKRLVPQTENSSKPGSGAERRGQWVRKWGHHRYYVKTWFSRKAG